MNNYSQFCSNLKNSNAFKIMLNLKNFGYLYRKNIQGVYKMKKLLICLFFLLAFCFNSVALSYEYTNEQRKALYDLITSSYLSSITRQIQTMQISEEKKQQIENFARSNINQQQLINQTWNCVQSKDPADQVGFNSCFIDWSKKQSADLAEYVLKLSY